MEFFTGALLSGMVYDVFKNNTILTIGSLKEKLQGWLVDDEVLKKLTENLKVLELDDLNERAIERKINETPQILDCIKEIKLDQKINSVTQIHNGTGDNVAGNKIMNSK